MAEVKESNYRDIVVGYLDYPNRHYSCDLVQETYSKKFFHEVSDTQLARYAQDVIGMNSDCFILYAIAMMGVADLEAIRLFLSALSQKEKTLPIIDTTSIEPLKLRLTLLHNNGFVFRHLYHYSYQDGNKDGEATAALYTLSNSALDFMNARLKKRVMCNSWISAKPISELVGIASCSYVSGMIAERAEHLLEQKQGIVRTKAIGTYIIPSILKMEVEDSPLYLGFMPAFLKKDDSFMSDSDFEDNCFRFINIIRQYFFAYDNKGKDSAMVIVVEDAEDLDIATKFIAKTGALKGEYGRIYFTGEGEFVTSKTDKLPCRFLMMEEDMSEEGFKLIPATIKGVVR